jgi:uncharacterized protein YndB with AHSA1/START domain
MSWFGDQAAAVTRSVVSKEWLGKPARAVIASRVYPTNIDDLWDALITPERLRRWFMPVSGDLREGGRYKLEGNAEGTINSCKPPRELAVTWEFNGGIGWVNVTLAEEADQLTSLTLEHIAHEDAAWLGFVASRPCRTSCRRTKGGTTRRSSIFLIRRWAKLCRAIERRMVRSVGGIRHRC